MSSAPFPERIDAVKMFARMGSITAELPLARLQRFSEQLSSKEGKVAVELHFGRDEEGRRLLTGTMDTVVQVACQRCLQDMQLDLHSSLALLVCDSEQELQALRESADGVVMTEDGLDVVALVEDELILSLPMIPMHADTGCNRVLNELRQGEDKGADGGTYKDSSPFAVLAGLKSAKNAAPDARQAPRPKASSGPKAPKAPKGKPKK